MKPSEKPTEKIDHLFRSKLEDHTLAPSDNAWARVETGFSKKNDLVLWRWAAAVLLMGALVSIIYWSLTTHQVEQKGLADKSSAGKKNKNAIKKAEEIDKQPSVVKRTSGDKKTIQKNNPAIKLQSPEIQKENIPVEELRNELIAGNEVVQPVQSEEKITDQATPKTEIASSRQKPIKLEFTLEDLPSEETVATTAEPKSKGLKKVLELAREMKQGEGPVLNFRQKKNELFAHNFITGKERTNKDN